jgi:8-oxo-dGTP diphosphatase
MKSNIIKVVCAIIIYKEKILAVQRGPKMSLPLKWEFPGGKVESNETEEECIKREIKEELNWVIIVLRKLSETYHEYPHKSIKLVPFLTQFSSGELLLKEHLSYRLLATSKLNSIDWAEADLPIVKELQSI